MNKPPAFQFYAKDWRSSMTVARMSREQRSIYLDMMAIAWDSEEPGTISMSETALCHELNILRRTLRRFLREFPSCWKREDGMKIASSSDEDGLKTGRRRREDLILTQPKLREQWLKYQEIQQKRSAIAQQMHMQKGGSAFALASASAPAKSTTTPLPPAAAGEQKFFEWCRETIAVQMGRRKRLPNLDAYHGAMACDVVAFLNRRGFPAKIVRPS